MQYSLLDYFKLLKQGGKIFVSDEFKLSKFSRFLGSILSVAYMYRMNSMCLYLPLIQIKDPHPVIAIGEKFFQQLQFNIKQKDVTQLESLANCPRKIFR